ncbi:SGNH/GDSL hydrolase family protein [Streptomyces sp. CRN 30]|uniref:SGNH/GDSL hydrolase family protein n=1 Tax=Streptomyces sp. CRN 30 TaxID=3075613 RepID=UPI002A82E49F|nr:SGNH/GDSL hydrolase family protein [Streptomyces sp. CRN 30]
MARFRTRSALFGMAAVLVAGAVVPAQVAGARPAAAADRQWAALGDSYTAGVVKAAGEVFEYPRDGCERTDRSYPQVIDRDLGSLLDLTNVSCGGATVENVTDVPQEPTGRNSPPFQTDPEYPFPPVPPQSAAVGPDTDVITVGVGGNTAGFGQMLSECPPLGLLTLGLGTPCKAALAANLPAQLEKTRQDYDQMLTVLRERAPGAKILAVGYPTVVPEDVSKCRYGDPTQFGTITRGDLDWLRRNLLDPLNEIIETSAAAHGAAGYVDLADSSRDHSVCDADKWVEGFVTRSGRQTNVHPNVLGHRNAADHVEAAILNALT